MQLHTKILLGLVLGIAVGSFAKHSPDFVPGWQHADIERFAVRWIEPVGTLFIRAIIVVVMPLVFASIATGIFGLGDVRTLGRVGTRTIGIFLATSSAAAGLAVLVYAVFEPGTRISSETRVLLSSRFAHAVDGKAQAASQATNMFSGSPLEVLVGFVPENLVQALSNNRDMLEVILFAGLLGVALTLIPREKADPVAKLLDGINEAMTKIIAIVMQLAPYGVFALVLMVVVRFGTDVLIALALYTVVVLVGLAVHIALVLLPLARFGAGWSPGPFLRASRGVWLTAFSTSSSNATLPTSLWVTEHELGVPKAIASFVLPLGATINMNGTTIYQVVAVLFVGQVFGVELATSAYVTLCVTAVLMAIGAAGVPGGVIPLLYVVMASIGMPDAVIPQGIALILGVDRVLDMCRTTLNVVGDVITACVVARFEPPTTSEPPVNASAPFA